MVLVPERLVKHSGQPSWSSGEILPGGLAGEATPGRLQDARHLPRFIFGHAHIRPSDPVCPTVPLIFGVARASGAEPGPGGEERGDGEASEDPGGVGRGR